MPAEAGVVRAAWSGWASWRCWRSAACWRCWRRCSSAAARSGAASGPMRPAAGCSGSMRRRRIWGVPLPAEPGRPPGAAGCCWSRCSRSLPGGWAALVIVALWLALIEALNRVLVARDPESALRRLTGFYRLALHLLAPLVRRAGAAARRTGDGPPGGRGRGLGRGDRGLHRRRHPRGHPRARRGRPDHAGDRLRRRGGQERDHPPHRHGRGAPATAASRRAGGPLSRVQAHPDPALRGLGRPDRRGAAHARPAGRSALADSAERRGAGDAALRRAGDQAAQRAAARVPELAPAARHRRRRVRRHRRAGHRRGSARGDRRRDRRRARGDAGDQPRAARRQLEARRRDSVGHPARAVRRRCRGRAVRDGRRPGFRPARPPAGGRPADRGLRAGVRRPAGRGPAHQVGDRAPADGRGGRARRELRGAARTASQGGHGGPGRAAQRRQVDAAEPAAGREAGDRLGPAADHPPPADRHPQRAAGTDRLSRHAGSPPAAAPHEPPDGAAGHRQPARGRRRLHDRRRQPAVWRRRPVSAGSGVAARRPPKIGGAQQDRPGAQAEAVAAHRPLRRKRRLRRDRAGQRPHR